MTIIKVACYKNKELRIKIKDFWCSMNTKIENLIHLPGYWKTQSTQMRCYKLGKKYKSMYYIKQYESNTKQLESQVG